MNNLYHKLSVASVCTALILTFGTNKEAKAATFTLTAGTSFSVGGGNFLNPGIVQKIGSFGWVSDEPEIRTFYEFNIGNLSLDPNTIISHAIFKTPFHDLGRIGYRSLTLELVGYVGNGIRDLSDFSAGVRIDYLNITNYDPYPVVVRSGEIRSDVTSFVNQQVSNGNDFAGLGIRVLYPDPSFSSYPNYGSVLLGNYNEKPTLTIETVDAVEPVPEPTTILGSALALSIGGWLKRKKSSQQNKTTSQH